MRIGVDVGGTNTDAVLMEGDSLINWHKSETSSDIGSGIVSAINGVIALSGCDPSHISDVMVGTTQLTNGLVERKGLLEVAVVRLASPSGHAVPPRIGWPSDLVAAVGEHTFLLPGGYEYDGREVSPFDEVKVRASAREIKRRRLRVAAVSSAFAPLNADMEDRAAAILREEIPGVRVSLSSDIGRIGLHERENSTILNAALSDLSNCFVDSLTHALRELGILARLYVSQNDGTLMSTDFAKRFPVLTFACGPTNSLRGAAFLAGVNDAVVMDIGGTTCDVGALQDGFPRQSSSDVNIGGVRTNFRMPDILSVALGGGTIIRVDDGGEKGREDPSTITVGPESVGRHLKRRSLIFGGDTLTATDVALAMQPELSFGQPGHARRPPRELAARIDNRFHKICECALDRIKLRPGKVPVVLVGGAGFLVRQPMRGCGDLIRPAHASVANAIGAAMAQVGGQVDQIYSYTATSRDEALANAKALATRKVARAGGRLKTLRFLEVEETALSYLPGDVVRVRVRAVADLAMENAHESTAKRTRDAS